MRAALQRETRLFFTALMFYTRLPCPSWTDHSEDMLNRATRYFPLMGLIVAALSFGMYWAATYLFSPAVSLLLSMIASVLTTGAFHEDGFADTCDGFGGGWTKGKILEIMKDSRVGTYGLVGLGLLLALKWATLLDVAGRGMLPLALALVSGHMVSRLGAVTIIVSLSYARENEDSKAKPVAKGVGATEVVLAAAFTAVPLVLLATTNPVLLLALLPPVGATLYLRRYFRKWIGGYTGDCLGAVQQVNEVVFYLGCLAVWNYT
jgi:adenosylcobinamide-GDP ribazoletransferase